MTYWGDGYWGDGSWGGGLSLAPDAGLGTPPLVDATPWERAAFQGGARPIARLTVESGGGEPVELTINDTALDVTRTMARGTQWLASATVLREANQDTEDRVTCPGAIFRLAHGWDYGGGFTELRPFGVYQLAKIPTRNRVEPINLELHDRWSQIVECEALVPVLIEADTDPATAITALVHQVDPTIQVLVNATGNPTEDVHEGTSRSDLITAISQAAQLYPHFDAEGRFVIDPAPTQRAPVASLTDGVNATLTAVTTEALFSAPYNAVAVDTGDPFDPYVLHVGDPAHPRHRNQPGMGVRPYRTESPLEGAALHEFALNLLSQLVGGIDRRTFSTWGRGDLNPGDWVSAIEAGTYLMPQRSSVSMVEEIRHNPLTVATEIVTRSTPRILTEEG